MKRINILACILFAMLFVACKDDPAVVEELVDEVIDYGDVDALFEARLLNGESVSTINMGELLTISDISKGRPDSREWTIVSDDGTVNVATDASKVQTLFFPVGDKDYNVTLRVNRSSDNMSDELLVQKFIHVKKVDVQADFVVNAMADELPKADGGGDYRVGRGLVLTFLNKSKGVPDNLAWEFQNGTPLNSDKNHQEVKFNKDGLVQVKLTATRTSDGSTQQVTKLIRVIQEYMNVVSAWVDNRTITLTYDQDVMTDPSVAKDDISVKILTAAGGTINAGIQSITSAGKVLTITLDQDTYHNDVVTLTYDYETGRLMAKNPAYIARSLNNYGVPATGNMLNTLSYDPSFEKTVNTDYTSPSWVPSYRTYNWNIKDDVALTGKKSMYIEIGVNAGNNGMDFLTKNFFSGIDANQKYFFGVWVYVVEAQNALGGSLWWMNNNDWVGRNIGTVPANVEKGKWTYLTGPAAITARPGTNGQQRFNLRLTGSGIFKFYMDNLILYPESQFRARPTN